MTRFFSNKKRPVHLGPYPLERLARSEQPAQFDSLPPFAPVSFRRDDTPSSIVNAMREYQAMLDAIRDGFVNKQRGEFPSDPLSRRDNLKGFAYFNDASMVGTAALVAEHILDPPIVNPDIASLAEQLRTTQTKTLAAGIDVIMADLKESMEAPPTNIDAHKHVLVLFHEFPRDPRPDEPGVAWIGDAQAARACLLAAENAVILANYIRTLGYAARAHSGACSDIDLNRAAVSAGLASCEESGLLNPYLGDRFGISAVTTDLAFAHDKPLVPLAAQARRQTHGIAWQLGRGFSKNASNAVPYAKRRFVDGAYPFEKLKRVATPTTYMDEARIPRVPKRTDMFARAQFGDMGAVVQKGALNGHYAIKSATSAAERRPLGAFVLLQNQTPELSIDKHTNDPLRNAENIKASCYFLGIDAVGISRCPEWAWYSHNARGEAVTPPHDQAISMVVDQGYETMEGASGDDWISVSQSMRAYLRFSLLGGVIAKQIRNLGYSAKAHTVMDGDVLQPPLLLLAGLGEVSRIGEVILNPFLGPRLKSGVVTTNMPLAHDKPIDFGLQRFCESCNKCARECPSGAITAGPKLMFNGYEIWKSDSQKCATYRITTEGGAMCGRCMKTCPWNLEGIFAEKPFRWAAMHLPFTAPALAKLDDAVNNGSLNPIKKWWWDIELKKDGSYGYATQPVNRRNLQKDLKLKYAEQTLAVYPAPLAPHPWPFPFQMDREKGIEAYQALITAEEYQAKLARNDLGDHTHSYRIEGDAPVIPVEISRVVEMTSMISMYEFRSPDGADLPHWSAGAHLDIVIAPGFLRQYSMSGDPADRSVYQIAVLREDLGRGGSKLMHRIFSKGRRIFISKPINHFPLDENATCSWLLAGGIGVTPLIAMAHRLYALGASFEFHYSCSDLADAGFTDVLAQVPWQDRIYWHLSSSGSRLDIPKKLSCAAPDTHLYTCGPDRFMNAILDAAAGCDWPDTHLHREFFSVPELPEYVNHPFTLRLRHSNRDIQVRADQSATDALLEAGVSVDVKCSDGLCGVCRCGLVSGAVEHRDFVLSKSQRSQHIILCQSRAEDADGIIEVAL